MPLYLDLHELPEGITAAHVAEMHQNDLDLEHKFNCRGLTYWCDEKRKTAFCLIDAPNEAALVALHEHAHGAIPTRIIEVNATIVESFLGRIEDPEKSKNVSLNIINDPAFRTLMVVKIIPNTIIPNAIDRVNAAIRGYTTSIRACTRENNGRLVLQENTFFLMSFDTVTDAVHCGLKIKASYNVVTAPELEFKIGLSAGTPITDNDRIFEDTIKTADYMGDVAKGDFTVTTAVKDLYEGENQNQPITMHKAINVVSEQDEAFIVDLMAYTEAIWQQASINVTDFETYLGYSKSKLYRTMMDVVGQSLNQFLRDYRLTKGLHMLDRKQFNISEIAYLSGFSSSAYFSKCFKKKYGVLPSAVIND